MITPTLTALLVGLGASAPTPLPPSPPGVPSFERFRLDNGLEVVLFESRASPWFEAHLVLGAGSLSDPDGKSGLAAMTAGAMSAGIPGADETALSDRLARLGASIDVSATANNLTVSGGIPTQDATAVAEFVTTLVDVALHPTFPEDIIVRDRARRIANVSRLTSRHGALADAGLARAVYGEAREGRPGYGLTADIAAVEPGDIRTWHRRVATPEHAVLLIGGSFDKAAVLAWVDAHLGAAAWPKEAVRCERGPLPRQCARLCDADGCLENPSATASNAPTTAGPRRLLVAIDDENASQIQWRMGFANAVSAVDPAYGALRVGFHVLGGDFTARLNQVLRAREGLTYGAYASADFGAYRPGLSTIRTDAPPDTLPRSVELTRELVHAIRTEPISADELAEVRANLANGFAFRFESIPNTLAQLRYIASNALPDGWLPGWVKTVTTPSAEAIRDALAAAIPDDGGHLVVVGPRTLLPALEAMDPATPWVTIGADALLAGGDAHAPLRQTASDATGRPARD